VILHWKLPSGRFLSNALIAKVLYPPVVAIDVEGVGSLLGHTTVAHAVLASLNGIITYVYTFRYSSKKFNLALPSVRG
jgi:hypothetical protein